MRIFDWEFWKTTVWSDPVWSKVIAGVLLSLIYLIFDVGIRMLSDTAGLWPIIKPTLGYEVSFQMQVWFITLIAILITYLSWPRLKSLKRSKIDKPDYTNYNDDNIFDIDWTWEWKSRNQNNSDYEIRNLFARCPTCGSRLEISLFDRRIVSCKRIECDWEWPNHYHERPRHDLHAPIRGKEDLIDKVETEIDRKVHTGEWKQ